MIANRLNSTPKHEETRILLSQLPRTMCAMIGGVVVECGAGSVLVAFKARARNGANYFAVAYDFGMDTYTVTFLRCRGMARKELAKFDDVHTGELRRVIESETGLALSLGTLGAA